MTLQTRKLGHFSRASLLALALVIAPCAVPDLMALTDEGNESKSLLGDYLAGRLARGAQDASTAADYYSKALARDPGNDVILEQTFLLEATAADWGRAQELAQKIIQQEPTHRIARFVLGCKAFRDGDFQAAEQHFTMARKGPLADLTATLARAWARQANGKTDDALSALEVLTDAEWARFYQRYHRGLIADLAGNRQVAEDSFAEAFKKNPGMLRIADAYARSLANAGNKKLARQVLKQHVEQSANHPLSVALLDEIDKGETPKLLVTDPNEGLAEVFYDIGDALTGEGGAEMGVIFLQLALYLRPDLPLAQLALAEAYEGSRNFEAAIGAYDRIDRTSPVWVSVQVRKALVLNQIDRVDDAKLVLEKVAAERPDDPVPLESLGNILRSRERYAEARDVYSRAIDLIGDGDKQSPTRETPPPNADKELPPGVKLAVADFGRQSDRKHAIRALQDVLNIRKDGSIGAKTRAAAWAADQTDVVRRLSDKRLALLKERRSWGKLGKRWTARVEATRARAIAMAKPDERGGRGNPSPRASWALYYSRGVCLERTGNWEKAESDLKKALALDGAQPLTLNYLGYTWVDKNRNVKKGMELIRKAVRLKPDDGYFVDSLGWAYYRIGDYKQSAEQLERAVELKPDDPVINDHLGDVYWQVGRRLEARYQWSQALSLKPEPADEAKIKQKIDVGLPANPPPTKAAERNVPVPNTQ